MGLYGWHDNELYAERVLADSIVSAAGTTVDVDGDNWHYGGQGLNFRYQVTDWTGLNQFQGLYLRAENKIDGASKTLRGAEINARDNNVGVGVLHGLHVNAYIKGTASGKTIGQVDGIQGQIEFANNVGTRTVTNDSACLHGILYARTTVTGLTKLHGVMLDFGDQAGGNPTIGCGIYMLDNTGVSGTASLTYGIRSTIDSTTGISLEGAMTTGIDITGTGTVVTGIDIGSCTTGIAFTGTHSGSCMVMGTSGTPLSNSTEEHHFVDAYYTAAGKNIFGWYLSISQTYATDGAPRGLTIRTSLDHTSGHTVQGANSIDARVTLGATNTGISGEMHAMESQLKVDADTRSLNGTYAAHKFTNYFKDGNTMPATTFFLRFVDQNGSSVATPLMFDFSGITAGASNCIVANTAALASAEYFLRVKSPDGGTGYIPILSALN